MSLLLFPSSSTHHDQAARPRRGRRSPERWSERVRSFLVAVRPAVLGAFVGRLGDEERDARKWPDADRAVVFRRVCTDSAFGLLAAQATHRGLPIPSTWMANLSAETSTALAEAMGTHPVAFVGVAYENLLANVPRFEKGTWVLGNSHDRRTEGAYFTPPPMAAFIAQKALQPKIQAATVEQLRTLTVLDPAMGSGAFLIQALHQVAERGRALGLELVPASRLALECLHGVDKDPDVVRIGAAMLWVEASDPSVSLDSLDARFKVGDALLGPAVGDRAKQASDAGQMLLLHPQRGKTAAAELKAWKEENGIHAGVFDWHLAFPSVFLDSRGFRGAGGGFDVVLGNPPWGKIKAELKEFFTAFDERVRDLQGAGLRRHVDADSNAAWKTFKADRAQYARLLKSAGTFSHQRMKKSGDRGSGDSDLYKYFMERAAQLVGPAGRIGLIVPASFYQSESASGLRHLFLGQGEIEDFLCFENRDKHFPIHSMFKYLLLIWQRGGTPGVRRARFNLPRASLLPELSEPSAEDPSMATAWLRGVSGERLILPELRDRREQELYGRVHAAHPPLGDRHRSWNVDFVRELDMTNDRDMFVEAAELSCLGASTSDGTVWVHPDGSRFVPLYEGRLVHQFDHAAKAYTGGAGRRARWNPTPLERKVVRPHYWVREDTDSLSLHARAGFCDITGHANERTVLAALIPPSFPCGNKVPTIRFDSDDPRLPYLWLAVANSLVIDWVMRRRVSTTINFFHWKMTPFPRLNPNDPRARDLWVSAARLSAIDAASAALASAVLVSHGEDAATPFVDALQRAQARADLDVGVAEVFGLCWTDLSLILEDFPLLDRHQRPLRGERRSTITRDLLLLAWCRKHTDASEERRVAARVREATQVGAVAYLPSEHAKGQG
jgi:hypothetical protein